MKDIIAIIIREAVSLLVDQLKDCRSTGPKRRKPKPPKERGPKKPRK